MRNVVIIAILLAVSLLIFLLFVWGVAIPKTQDLDYLKKIEGNVPNGRYVFNISGCGNCHSTVNSKSEFELGGGEGIETAFGVFYAPNVSTSKKYGIGDWTIKDFGNAIKRGVDPRGRHYFPAFPYTSYRLISDKDLVDLWTFWQTLPAVEIMNREHELRFPFFFRPLIFWWKMFNLDYQWVRPETNPRGRYLVEALGHCGECHTSRSLLGRLNRNKWLEGASDPSGRVKIPGITSRILKWSEEEIVEYLSTGFTPEFDVVGGRMVKVIENTSRLRVEDLDAVASYLLEVQD